MKQSNLIFITLFIVTISLKAQQFNLDFKVSDCFAHFEKDTLKVGNNKMERVWQWTGKGLATISIKNKISQKEWCDTKTNVTADWKLPLVSEMPEGKIRSIKAIESDDEKFTANHLKLNVEIEYPSLQTTINYEVWVFPDVSGIRSQLFVKSERKFEKQFESQGIPSVEMKVISASEAESTNTVSSNVFDNNLNTVYRTKSSSNDNVPFTYLVIDLGSEREIESVAINQIKDYYKFGYVSKCAVYVSNNPKKWDTSPIGVGDLSRSVYLQYINCTPTKARYIRVTAIPTSAVNLYNFKTAIAEIKVFDKVHPVVRNTDLEIDFYPINANKYVRRGMGYYADTQFRNSLEIPFLKEETKQGDLESECWNWNSILSVEDRNEGLCLVKESHKTVIQNGHYTGEFICTSNGIETTGWGMAPDEITKEYKKCWANWMILYQGQDDERQLAIKIFDRQRFPNTLPGHSKVYACSWGNSDHPQPSRGERDGALERNVLSELDASKAAGVEIYLIDDGWQVHPDSNVSIPVNNVWHPHPVTYPNEWKTVSAKAKENNIRLALWTSLVIPPADLQYNQDRANFVGWKFDFGYVYCNDHLSKIETKARNFIKDNNYQLSIQWDLTENTPRYGFYWGREYGIIWVENRERVHARYNPPVVLRDAWELSKYVNLGKFQLPIRNINDFNKAGNGMLYNIEYCNAITFMANPMFFEKVGSYSTESLDRIKKNLELYKSERDEIKNSYVFPIGEKPNNESFTGFQAVSEDGNTGHILLYRELYATEATHDIKLRFLKNVTLRLENLKTQKTQMLKVDENGITKFIIENAADFEYYRYEIIK